MKRVICILFVCVVSLQLCFSQAHKPLVQLSGLVLTSDSLIGLPYATVLIKNEGRGTLSNYQGFFSLVTYVGDTVIFTSIGFRPEEIIIPDSLSLKKYSVIQLLTRDTIYLPETVIYPWPTKEEFRNAFLSLNLPDDDLARAKKNLERQRMKELGEAMTMDSKENADYYLRQQAQKFYYAGQAPPMNIFNPIAWSQFIQAWQNGDFKRQTK